jgi:hypothetical protein
MGRTSSRQIESRDQEVEGIRHRPFEAVLDRHHAFIRHPRIDGGRHCGDGRKGKQFSVGVMKQGSLLCEGAGRPQVGKALGH